MRTCRAIAVEPIRRGEWCELIGEGARPDPTLKTTGGIARRDYSGWPPTPILPGEELELLVDGGVMGMIGDKPFWLEVRDGRVRLDLANPAHFALCRQALVQAGIEPE